METPSPVATDDAAADVEAAEAARLLPAPPLLSATAVSSIPHLESN